MVPIDYISCYLFDFYWRIEVRVRLLLCARDGNLFYCWEVCRLWNVFSCQFPSCLCHTAHRKIPTFVGDMFCVWAFMVRRCAVRHTMHRHTHTQPHTHTHTHTHTQHTHTHQDRRHNTHTTHTPHPHRHRHTHTHTDSQTHTHTTHTHTQTHTHTHRHRDTHTDTETVHTHSHKHTHTHRQHTQTDTQQTQTPHRYRHTHHNHTRHTLHTHNTHHTQTTTHQPPHTPLDSFLDKQSVYEYQWTCFHMQKQLVIWIQHYTCGIICGFSDSEVDCCVFVFSAHWDVAPGGEACSVNVYLASDPGVQVRTSLSGDPSSLARTANQFLQREREI